MGRVGSALQRFTGRGNGDVEVDKAPTAAGSILLVGNPNVGKSALFNWLTGRYVTVSNYPGTTVEVSRGQCRAIGRGTEVIDTPGMYSLLPITEEERVARAMLLEGLAAGGPARDRRQEHPSGCWG